MKLPVISGKDMMKFLFKLGFEKLDQKGSHVILIKQDGEKKLKPVIPLHKELKKGTLLSIIRQAGLTREQFLNLYSTL